MISPQTRGLTRSPRPEQDETGWKHSVALGQIGRSALAEFAAAQDVLRLTGTEQM